MWDATWRLCNGLISPKVPFIATCGHICGHKGYNHWTPPMNQASWINIWYRETPRNLTRKGWNTMKHIETWWHMKEKLQYMFFSNKNIQKSHLTSKNLQNFRATIHNQPPAPISHWKQHTFYPAAIKQPTTRPASTWGFSWQPSSLRASILSRPLPSMDHPWHRENPLFRLFWREFWWTTQKIRKQDFLLFSWLSILMDLSKFLKHLDM